MASVTEHPKRWDGAVVRHWLDSRFESARADQVAAERHGRAHQDDCDKAAAEEMICSLLRNKASAGDQAAFAKALATLLDRETYIWRGVYDDTRFDRHVRTYIKKLARMTKTNSGFDNLSRYQ
jgi:hypothetical protein